MQKRGLSGAVITVISLLLVLITIGLVWTILKNVIDEGAGRFDVASKCFEVSVKAKEVIAVSNEPGNYSVTLERNPGGGEIEGIKLNFFNGTNSSGVVDFGVPVSELDVEMVKIQTDLINANKIQYTAYFKDNKKEDFLCPGFGEFSF